MGRILKILFTQEERKEYQKIELQMLKKGYTGVEIAEKIGISEDTVSTWKNELIKRGEITQKEIDKARERRKELEKAEAKKTDPARRFVLEKRLEGKSLEEIVAEGPYGKTVVWRNIKELEAEGLATKEMVEEARRKRKEEEKEASKKQREINGAKEIDDNLRKAVLKELKKGLSSKMIIKKLQITAEILRKVKKQLIDAKKITQKKIKEAQERRLKRDKKKILELLLEGLSIPEIVEKIEDSYYDYVKDLIKELKEEGQITDEEIKKARFERNQRELMELAIEGFEAGLSGEEIADKYKEKYGKTISRQHISEYKARIIDEGIMTNQEIIQAQKKHLSEKNNEKRLSSEDNWDERIIVLFNLGFSQAKISKIFELDEDYVKRRKQVFIGRGKLTKKGIETARKNIEKEADKRRMLIAKMSEDVDLDIIRNHLEYIRAKVKLGEANEKDEEVLEKLLQVAPKLIITPNNISLAIRYYISCKRAERAINFIDKCIVVVESNSPIMPKLLEAKKEVYTFVEREKAEKSIEKIGKREKVEARRKSINEMLSLEKRLSKKIFEEHMRYVRAQIQLGCLEMQDFNLLKELIQMYPELMQETNVRFISDYLIKQNEQQKAYKFVNACRSTLGADGQQTDFLKKIAEELRIEIKGRMDTSEFRRGLRVQVETGNLVDANNISWYNKREHFNPKVATYTK